MDIPIKSTGDQRFATEDNQITNELENAILNSGQTLSAADVLQVSKSLSFHAAAADYYSDSGTADVYVLSSIGSFQGITSYSVGQRVRFIPTNSNTGGVATINVNALGVKSLKLIDGVLDPPSGTVVAGRPIELLYDGTNFLIVSVSPSVVRKFETKTLNSYITSDGVMPDVTFTLTAGRTYRISGQFTCDVDVSGADPELVITVKDGVDIILRLLVNDEDPDRLLLGCHFSELWTMTGTSLTFEVSSASTNSRVAGDGTRNESFVTVEEVFDIEIGTVT